MSTLKSFLLSMSIGNTFLFDEILSLKGILQICLYLFKSRNTASSSGMRQRELMWHPGLPKFWRKSKLRKVPPGSLPHQRQHRQHPQHQHRQETLETASYFKMVSLISLCLYINLYTDRLETTGLIGVVKRRMWTFNLQLQEDHVIF